MREIGHEIPKQDQSTFTVESGLTFPFWEIKLLSSSCHSNRSAVFSAQMVKMVGFPEPVISWGIILYPGLLVKVFLHKIDPGRAQRVVRTRVILGNGKLSIQNP